MYSAATRVEMVKERIRQRQREIEKRKIFALSALCVLVSAALAGSMRTFMGTKRIAIPGLYGSILLHENAGGYVLVGVVSFTAAVIFTVLCIKYRKQNRTTDAKEDKHT